LLLRVSKPSFFIADQGYPGLPYDKGGRTFECFDCDRDPMKTDCVIGWLKGELQPPK